MAVSVERTDRLRFVEVPSPDLSGALLATFGPAVQKNTVENGHFEIKFHGNPWLPHGTDTVTTRIMILNMLQTLERFGWSLHASLHVPQGGGEGQEADIMYFQKQLNWVPGNPIWHR